MNQYFQKERYFKGEFMKQFIKADRFKEGDKIYTIYDTTPAEYEVAYRRKNSSDYETKRISRSKLNKMHEMGQIKKIPTTKPFLKKMFRNIVVLEKERANGRKTWIVKDGFGFYNWELDFYSGKYFSISRIDNGKEIIKVKINSKKELKEVFKIVKDWFVTNTHIVKDNRELDDIYISLIHKYDVVNKR